MTTDMRRAATILLPLVALGGCSLLPGSAAAIEKEARAGLQRTLSDTSSAKFSEVRLIDGKSPSDPKIICGLVNAKNLLGAYVGWRRFLVERGTGFAVVSPDADRGSSDAAQDYQAGFDEIYPKERCPR